MTGEFAMGHMTNGVDEVTAVEVLKPVLIQVVGVGMTVKVHHGRVLHPILIMSIL